MDGRIALRRAAGGGVGEFLVRAARRFMRDDRGGAMLVTGAFVIATMFAGGAGLLNLAWYEAHREEVRAALRAAIASAGASLLARAGDGGAVDQAIAERVEAFVEAATPIDVDDVTVSYANGRVDVGLDGQMDVDALWNWDGFFGGSFSDSQAVSLTTSKHEFAVALDVSGSMRRRFGAGTRMDALKAAMRTVADNLEEAQRDSPAGMLVSVAPFASTVRVADIDGIRETEDKARYLRMMGGRLHAKWVDMYHHYGVGGTHEITIPAGWAWDPNIWSGCVMARWGAYWDPLARPVPMTWPAKVNGEPLHLTDAAPDVGNANTLFTPYSWPDAGPAGDIDARLQQAMAEALTGGTDPVPGGWFGDNDWSLEDGGGDELCQQSSMLPLTDDVAIVRQAVDDLRPEEGGPGGRAYTYTHLGIVWGLRLLSAGWQDIWNTTDFRGAKRPLPSDVDKTVLVVSDGQVESGWITHGHLLPRRTTQWGTTVNPRWSHSPACQTPVYQSLMRAGYHGAAGLDDRAFNARFGSGWRASLAAALERPELEARLGPFEPVDAFRGGSAAFADVLVDVGLPRPTEVRRHLCDQSSGFGIYGRLGDPLYVGGQPVLGHSPWVSPGEQPSASLDGRLYAWWDEACLIAAARDVQVHTIFIGNNDANTADHIDSLRRCSAATGGRNFVTPDAPTLRRAFSQLVRLRRDLRFVD